VKRCEVGGGDVLVPFEPKGFTGKEDDQEVGLVYFGERYLIPGLGRWASPDPLAIHGMGGGEILNSFHYIAGNLLAGRDAIGLEDEKVKGNWPVPTMAGNITTFPYETESGHSLFDEYNFVHDPDRKVAWQDPSKVGKSKPYGVYQYTFFIQGKGSDTQTTFDFYAPQQNIDPHAGESMLFAAIAGAFMEVSGTTAMLGMVDAIHSGDLKAIAYMAGGIVLGYGAGKLLAFAGRAIATRVARREAALLATDAATVAGEGVGGRAAGEAGGELAGKAPGSPCRTSCFVAGTAVVTPDGSSSIELLEVGDRVLTPFTGEQASEIDASWRLVVLTMAGPAEEPGDVVDISLLRSPAWLAANGVIVGGEILLELPEMGLFGPARVVAVGAPKAIGISTGRVVTGTVNHVSSYIFLLDLGDQGVLEVTGAHRLYSHDRTEWIRVDALGVGEALETGAGPVRLVSISAEERSARVYNIEVDAEHAYLAGDAQVWSHNQCACGGGGRLPRYEGKKPSYHVNEAHVKGSPKYNPHKEPLPADAEEVFKTAVPDQAVGAKNWFGRNKKGVTYRFSNGANGTAHFSGSDASKDGIRNFTQYAEDRLDGK
jgi:RHS repeat-associated protein